jgi:hypothetical protein
MSSEQVEELISGAGDALARARGLLLHPAPRNLDIACSSLTIAIGRITELLTVLSASPSRDMAAAVVELRAEVGLISRLLEHAASYHVNLIQCMIEASGVHLPADPCVESARCVSVDA